MQKKVLQKAGTGLKKIVFDLEDTEEEVYAKIYVNLLIGW